MAVQFRHQCRQRKLEPCAHRSRSDRRLRALPLFNGSLEGHQRCLCNVKENRRCMRHHIIRSNRYARVQPRWPQLHRCLCLHQSDRASCPRSWIPSAAPPVQAELHRHSPARPVISSALSQCFIKPTVSRSGSSLTGVVIVLRSPRATLPDPGSSVRPPGLSTNHGNVFLSDKFLSASYFICE